MNTRTITIAIILLIALMSTIASFGAQAQTVKLGEYELTLLPQERVPGDTVLMFWGVKSPDGLRWETNIVATGCHRGRGRVFAFGYKEDVDLWMSTGTTPIDEIGRAMCKERS